MAEPDFIVTELVGVDRDGSQFDVVIRVGKPFPDKGPFVCVVQMDGVDDEPRRLYGEGPMQALHFGLQLVKENLSYLEERGARLYRPGQDPSGEPFDWRQFWYGCGDSTAG